MRLVEHPDLETLFSLATGSWFPTAIHAANLNILLDPTLDMVASRT